MAPDDFRAAMRQIPAAVTIVTTSAHGVRHGLTATAVASVSADPPQVLVCVNRAARSSAAISVAGRFGLNYLDAEHVELAEAFAAPTGDPEDRFRRALWSDSPSGTPLLLDALVAFECIVVNEIRSGNARHLRRPGDRRPLPGRTLPDLSVRRLRQPEPLGQPVVACAMSDPGRFLPRPSTRRRASPGRSEFLTQVRRPPSATNRPDNPATLFATGSSAMPAVAATHGPPSQPPDQLSAPASTVNPSWLPAREVHAEGSWCHAEILFVSSGYQPALYMHAAFPPSDRPAHRRR